MPQLTRVIVAYSDKVAMEADLSTALLSVFGEAAKPPGPEQPAADATQAKELYDLALEAQRSGDWAAYGRYIQQLGEVLSALSGETTATPQP